MNTQKMRNAYLAFAGLMHDIGKMTERGRIDTCEPTEGDVTNYCPQYQNKPHTHKHAAWTAKTLDDLENKDGTPAIANIKDINDHFEDSIINISAKHHKPDDDNIFHWLITCADRLASGFERHEYETYTNQHDSEQDDQQYPSHYRARLQSPLAKAKNNNKICHSALTPMSPKSVFFTDMNLSDELTSKQQYADLYKNLKHSLQQTRNKNDFPLWLSHCESAFLHHTYCIPSATPSAICKDIRPEVSLYDHSKAVAGFAVALSQYFENADDKEALSYLNHPNNSEKKPFLIIQGDFVGIQDFIFNTSLRDNKNTAKMLRGKSFFVSLLTELACLKVLESLNLPSTSRIISAAGKFTIIAGNTDENKQKLHSLSTEISQWFLTNFYGQGNIVFAWTPAHSRDFLIKKDADDAKDNHFSEFMEQLHKDLDIKKHQSHMLYDTDKPFNQEYKKFTEHGSCDLNTNIPATHHKDHMNISNTSADYITIGEQVVQNKHMVISTEPLSTNNPTTLKQDIFGFHVSFMDKGNIPLNNTADMNIVRIWDYHIPNDEDDSIFKGICKINISGHVPKWDTHMADNPIYSNIPTEVDNLDQNTTIPFNVLAHTDLQKSDDNLLGIPVIAVVKGDIDDLGKVFMEQAEHFTFAGLAGLSRQVDAFFSIYLPTWLKNHEQYKYCYTVFAGGDDFLLIGPWYRMHALAQDLRKQFQHYTQNEKITFSVGVVLCDQKTPLKNISHMGETALSKAKKCTDKNSICLFDCAVSWQDFDTLKLKEKEILDLNITLQQNNKHRISTGYVYDTLQFTHMVDKENDNPKNAMWLSRHTYRTARYIMDNKIDAFAKDMHIFLDMLNTHKQNAKIPLTLYLYKHRTYKPQYKG